MIFLLHNLKKGFLKIACNAASYFCNNAFFNMNEFIHVEEGIITK